MSNIIQVSEQFEPSSVVFTKMKKNKNGGKKGISFPTATTRTNFVVLFIFATPVVFFVGTVCTTAHDPALFGHGRRHPLPLFLFRQLKNAFLKEHKTKPW